MATKFSRYCSGIMEAVWLAAVCIIPLFFNIYSSRIFEPDKIAILRSLALFSIAAWFLKLIDEGFNEWKETSANTSLFRYLWKYPVLAPVMGLGIVYILATIFSVTPSISIFGSYQRLQGTYTTFSYLIIFASIISNMRTRNQVNRLITTVIFASFPVTIYALLQRYQLDPIPWGGNVSIRVAANMGNSIFIAAYLIMVFPLTVGKVVSSFREILTDEESKSNRVRTVRQITKATLYVFIAALQLIAIYMSGSRGPMLGLMAGIYLLFLLLSIYWKKRWMTLLIIGLALLGAVFLAVFNIKGGPLEALRKSPAIGRFGSLIDPESNSALVRQYIWEGAVDLVGIHDPLKFPDGGSDKFNFLRLLIGYGPESMYVAYNQFYRPDLGQVERRNASPDRSHNETWDSVVITGLAGAIVYLSVFSSVFYYGLKWQGLIQKTRDKYLFFALLIGGGLIGAVSLVLISGVEFLGVGLPFGMIIGVVLYLTIYAVFFAPNNSKNGIKNPYTLLLIVIFSAIVGHFVEINFGIAIVATRTLFWTLTGVMVVIGHILPQVEMVETQQQSFMGGSEPGVTFQAKKRAKGGPGKTRRSSGRNWRPLIGDQPDWVRYSLVGAVIIGVILVTLSYDYVGNSSHSTSFFQIIINSLTRLPKNDVFSPGILALMLMTWLAGSIMFSVEMDEKADNNPWMKVTGLILLGSLFVGLLFIILHAISLASLAGFTPATQDDVITQVNSIGALLTKFYIYIFLLLLLVALILPEEWPQKGYSKSAISVILAPVFLVLVIILINVSNLRVIHADITFKMAEPFTKNGQWDVATFLYKRALELAPKEDHYYLFLGRSYLEQAKVTEDTSEQDRLVLQAENDLKVAQSINPLNTDHTANLARLYSWWAGKATDSAVREERGLKASDYYETAVTLSPNNSTIWDEWAILYLQVFRQTQEAYQRLQHALSLDSRYSFTQGLMGDYYLNQANATEETSEKIKAFETAAEHYQTAADVVKKDDTASKATYLVSMVNSYLMMARLDPQYIGADQIQQVIDTLIESMNAGVSTSETWRIQEAIAKLYVQLMDKTSAKIYAEQALAGAPSNTTQRIQELIAQIQAMP